VNVIETALPGVLIVEPKIFGDERGFFVETWQKQRYEQAGITASFVQDNAASSRQKTLRGLHFQNPNAQAKLVYALEGEVFDVTVDIRKGSPTFGHWAGVTLSANNARQVFIPEGFAHGYCVLSGSALVAYKCTEYYNPKTENSIRWDDPDIGIDWPVGDPVISEKDAAAPLFRDVDPARLPVFTG